MHVTLTTIYRAAAVLLLLSATSLIARAQPGTTAEYDLLVRGGRIVDGTGNPWFIGDIAIVGDRIVRVGTIGEEPARRVVDATGLVVAPGFIDLHGHSTNALLTDGNGESKLRQGVTLEVVGEGESPAPANDPAEGRSWETFTDYFAELMRDGISMNLIAHVSYNQIRRNVMGYKEGPASPAELERMREVTAQSMRDGAWGMTSEFPSGGPEHIAEVIELARVVAAYGGNFTSHTGSEGFEQTAELEAVFRIAEEADIPVHTFHLKVRSEENWGTMRRFLDQIETARERGLDVTSNQYPYTAMNHGWAEFFPLWAREGGPEAFARRLNDPAARERIKSDPDFRIWSEEHGDWDGIVLGYAAHTGRPDYEGMTIAEIAASRGDADPADTAIALMAEENGRIRGLFHTMSEEDVRLIMRQPWVAIASDGQAINMENYPGLPHPRYYGTNARVLGHYVREERVLTLEDAVRKMTSLPAQILRLADRGQIREGSIADLAIFDPQTVRATNSFEDPRSYAEGVYYTIVNGVIVIDDGEHTGARPGRAVLGHGTGKTL
ncbi:MAG: amidohydrolase family protein [Gammaproteobacteria bacterium]|nr:amidohydrolase family protein [Gammaproteobacteria bacterium]